MVAHNTIHTRFRQTSATEKVATANHHANLDTQFNQFFDFLCHAVKNACIDTEAFCSLQRFATKLKQNAFVHGFCIGSHVSFLRLSTIEMGVNSGDIVRRLSVQKLRVSV
ncbi:hypothetical protein D3C87_1805980 [compost metagenome]